MHRRFRRNSHNQSLSLTSSDEDAEALDDEEPDDDPEAAAAAAAVAFVVNTSELSCFSVCVRFLDASASARVSNFGL